MKSTPLNSTSPLASAQAPEILYRFQVEDPKTGEVFFVLMGEDGLAFRETPNSMRKAG